MDYDITTATSNEKWNRIATSPAVYLDEVYATPRYIGDFALAFLYAMSADHTATGPETFIDQRTRLQWIIDEVPQE